jgi:uncharacterized protein (TIGR03067 family)
MRRTLLFVVIATLAFAGLSNAGDPKKDLQALQGNWTVKSIQESDPQMNPPPEALKEMMVNFKGDIMTINFEGKTAAKFKIKLGGTKSPKTIDMTHEEGPEKGKTELGIYNLQGNTFTFCVNDAGKPRPTKLATVAKTEISLVELQKAKK